MAAIPFTKDKAQSGAKVFNKKGVPVDIIRYDIKGKTLSMVGILSLPYNEEEVQTFTDEGKYYLDGTPSDMDLVIVE